MALIESIESSLLETSKLKDDTFNAISNALEEISRADLQSESIPNGNESIDGIQSRLSGFCSLAEQVVQEDLDITLISHEYLEKFKNHIDKINSNLAELINNLNRVKDQGGFGAIDNQYTISNKGNNHNYALGQGLINLDSSIDRALERYYLLSPAINRPDVTKLSHFTRNFEGILDELKQAKAAAKRDATLLGKQLEEAERHHKEAINLSEKIAKLHNETLTNRDKSQSDRNEIESLLKQSQEKMPAIQQTFESAEGLKTKINGHHERLDQFDNEMESRERASKEGKEKLESIIKDIQTTTDNFQKYKAEQKSEIEEIIKRAEDMLGISTSAGLGENFKQQAKKRGTSIKLTYGIIIICLVAIASLGWAAVGGDATIDIKKIIFKLSAVIPLGLLVLITTRSLRKLEQSKEYYEHKASVSQAVEGYRKLYEGPANNEAPERVNLINNTVNEVLKNPADTFHHTHNEDPDLLKTLDKFADIVKKMKS